MAKPCYVINGFLDSGKTSFFRYTLAQPYFKAKGRTLLILCEDGEEAYGDALLTETKTVVETIEEVDGQMFICADHGNAEEMVDEETGESWTAHTTNPVPFILVNYDPSYTLKEGGCLADIAPTLIEMMGMEKPAEMTGESLLVMK